MCLNCFRFGHIAKHCKSKPRCKQCGSTTPHDDSSLCTHASGPPKCVNCNGSHRNSSKQCPEYIFQKEIRYYATTHKTSFEEAKEIIRPRKSSNLSNTFNFSNFPDLGDCPTTPASILLDDSSSNRRSFAHATSHKTHAQFTLSKDNKHSKNTKNIASSFFATNFNNSRSQNLLPNGFALANSALDSSSTQHSTSPSLSLESDTSFSFASFISWLNNHVTNISSNCTPDTVKQNKALLITVTENLLLLLNSTTKNNNNGQSP
ncbi:uncharacterized protein LOC122508793 [Leptopilina heterotoma]|uniref:uncharacterized protein LOC122508793 n=1 Tax=Leptopilina heterotoma TaxID=63436 RepID=UPI001CA9B871|nr:uncharacterized protein LOC122508793 [Leptopilina heterotoma]